MKKDMRQRQRELYESGNIWKSIAAMAVPSMLIILIMICYQIADMYFVGMLGDNAQIAAISIVSPVYSVIMAIGSMIGIGGCTVISRGLGSGDKDQVRTSSSVSLTAAIAIGITLAALIILFREPLLTFLGTNDEIRPYARTYMVTLSAGAPALLFTTVFGNLIRAEGAIKEGLMANLTASLSNIALDPLFILGFHLGVGGAALATVLANCIGVLFLIAYVVRKSPSLTLNPAAGRQHPKAILDILAVGLPNALSTLIAGFASTFVNQTVVSYGTTAVAAMAAAHKSTFIIAMLQMGLCMGVQPLMAYNYGAGNAGRLSETIKKMALLTFICGISLTAFCFIENDLFVGLFLKEASAVKLGALIVRIIVLSGPFLGFYYLSTNFLQSTGSARTASLLSVMRQGLLLIPLLFLFHHFLGFYGVVYAQVTADTASALTAVLLAVRHYRRLKAEQPKKESIKKTDFSPLPDR